MNTLYISLLLLSIISIAMATSPFVGEWNLVEVHDENDAIVTIPDGSFVMRVEEGKDEKSLKFNFKIGNRLRGNIQIQDDGSVTVGPIMSTMMMPPEPIWKLETFANNGLQKVTEMVKETDASLELKGEGGRFKFDLVE
mmetsp:Transcript_72800/g.109828  ORF Transcript_72800/g.109828 Transcript_72800/m.109828 type:complete len:139 (+) Transcript_72800:53-469(+)